MAFPTGWDYRKKITVLATKVAGDHTDFIIPIDLENLDANFHTNVKSDGADIRVTTSDGTTEVPVDVCYYDSANDLGLIIFKGTIDGDDDTDFYLWYGNSSATLPDADATYGRENVYSSEVKGFWWLGTDPTSGVIDRTTNDNDLAHTAMDSGNLTTGNTCIGDKAISFDGADELLSIASGSQTGLNISTTGLHIGVIAYKDDDTPAEQHPINKDDSSDGQYSININSSDQALSISNWDDYFAYDTSHLTNTTWHFTATWWDGGTTNLGAVDGNAIGSTTTANKVEMPDGEAGVFEIGSKTRYGRDWDGKIAFAWVVQSACATNSWGSNWYTSMYNAFMDNVNFYTEGGEEEMGGITVTPTVLTVTSSAPSVKLKIKDKAGVQFQPIMDKLTLGRSSVIIDTADRSTYDLSIEQDMMEL